MKKDKATGPDEIPAEVWKCLGEEGIDILWNLIDNIYRQEQIPYKWRESVRVHIYKGKGDIQDWTLLLVNRFNTLEKLSDWRLMVGFLSKMSRAYFIMRVLLSEDFRIMLVFSTSTDRVSSISWVLIK